MIGFFPTPYPDELLYSVCARYGKRVNYPNKKTTIEDLFGRKGFSAIVDFPNRLEDLLSSLPSHNYTADEIINQNTLFPFHEPFLSNEKAIQSRGEMKFSKANNLRMRLAVNIPQVKTPEYLRFCSFCVQDDRKNYGETYWHRLHQLAGILVCNRHLCFLQNSFIKWDRESSYIFHCAEDSLKIQSPQLLIESSTDHKLFLYLADNAEWLLSKSNLSLREGELRERYYNLLLERKYAFYNGRIKNKELLEDFNNKFTSKILEIFGCELRTDCRNWLSKFLEEYKVKTIHHPVRHLLLMNFLDITPVKFFTVFTEFKPFGYGPYSCLNKASDHYRELRIQKCQIYDNLSKEEKFRGSIAVFSCDCGFIYQRRGPDKSNEDRFFYDSVREYGTVWENTLAQLWADSSFSLTHIGEKLGVSSTSVGRHAIRLNLPMNTKNTRSLNGYDRHRNPKPSFSEMRGNYRNEWLNLRKNNLKLTRLELMKKFNFIYLWLKRNDSEWFESHLPKITRVSEKNDILDWEKIDKQLSEEVSYICDEIFNIKTFPIRISITEIIRRAGNKGWIEKRKIKLPMTSVVIDKKLESLEEFMIRKVEWAENEFLKKGKIPTQMELKVTARVRNKTSEKSEKVQQSINEAIKKLESLLL